MPVLEIRNLTKIYDGRVRALDDVSLKVQRGEFLVVVGLSGSGKSTLMRCINRLVEPTAGQVLFDGVDVTAASPEELRLVRRRIGMVFQHFNLVRRSSVLTNVLSGRLGYVNPWPSLLHRFPAVEVERAMANLRRVGIEEKAEARADELSGGQQQRVGIARALMQDPEMILADEPVSALDPATSHSVLRYLEEINREDGTTILCNLHFLDLARRYGTRIIALKAGRLIFDGLPSEIDRDRFREIYGEEAQEVGVS
ncbi:MAG: phosphonate ABC transporter ATP-binding protein [Chloroflexi bacterium]|nr:phosphonate ABC transporter ATP-binding protein [Chloroflexota bacterium]